MKKRYKYALLLGATCIVILLVYFWMHSSIDDPEHVTTSAFLYTPMPTKHNKSIHKMYKDKTNLKDRFFDEENTDFVVNTPRCKIPVTRINYTKHHKTEKNNRIQNCGNRAVIFHKINGNTVEASINTAKMNLLQNKRTRNVHCSYRFFDESNEPGYRLGFTDAKALIHGAKINLLTDFIRVKCVGRNNHNESVTVYEDFYAFTKRKISDNKRGQNCKDNYNVLMLGMDSMSLPRLEQTMPRTIDFLHKNSALSFRGYHKVGDNTFPNLMAALSGFNLQTLQKHCKNRMNLCNIIWKKFKDIGYITAYGEDFLNLPDTFGKHYKFFKSPTDHHIRPLFINKEKEINKTLICNGEVSAGSQLLDYAKDFVTTYQNDNFFGVFWLNSFSHNENSRSQDADRLLESFLSYTVGKLDILKNTFIIFLSDQGLRFGQHRMKIDSYYDERLPFLFIMPPRNFIQKYSGTSNDKLSFLMSNQRKLVTPYDLYNTLYHVYRLSDCSNRPVAPPHESHACPDCTSLFIPINTTRRCQDAAIDDKWCSCHKLYPLDPQDDLEGMHSVHLTVYKVNKTIKSIPTKPGWVCAKLIHYKIIRKHFYYDEHDMSLYFVVAFTMTPGNVSFEAIINRSKIVGNISVISPYRGLGKCTTDTNIRSRLYCFCEKKIKIALNNEVHCLIIGCKNIELRTK